MRDAGDMRASLPGPLLARAGGTPPPPGAFGGGNGQAHPGGGDKPPDGAAPMPFMMQPRNGQAGPQNIWGLPY